MRRTVTMAAPTFCLVLLLAGAAFAVTRMCPGDCRGTGEDDRLVGSARANTIYAEGGDDRVVGRAGDDALKGGDGRDEVYGGEGNDLVRGGTHGVANDHARDLLICGPGRDKVYFVRGQDVIRGCEVKRPSN